MNDVFTREISSMVQDWKRLNTLAFRKICKKVFDAQPSIQSFGWDYTYQYNDEGYSLYHPRYEAITFTFQEGLSVYPVRLHAYEDTPYEEWSVELNGVSIDEPEDEWYNTLRPLCECVAAFMEAFTAEELAMFTGSNVEVMVSRETIDITAYDSPY
jgi:hypothetical protein